MTELESIIANLGYPVGLGMAPSTADLARMKGAIIRECNVVMEQRDKALKEIGRLKQEITGHLKAWDIEHVEVERLRALVQQHGDEVWVGLERAKDVRNATIEECRAAIIEQCVKVVEQWENDDTPRSYLDLIAAIRALKDR